MIHSSRYGGRRISAQGPHDGSAPPEKPRILVVEDDALLGPVVVRVLKRAGYEAELARNRQEALSVERSFDLALMDLDLPDGVGTEVYQRLAESERATRVVFFTGTSSWAVNPQARSMGRIVHKSESAEALLAAIRDTLAEPSRARSEEGPDSSGS